MKKILTTLLILILTISLYSQDSKKSLDFSIPISDLNSLIEKNLPLYQFSKEWIGTRYVMGGNDKNGIDCSGFSKTFYHNTYNKEIPRTAIQQYKFVKKILKSELISGDLIFFKGSRWHVGIYLINGYFIHSSNKKTGVKISNLASPYYEKVYLSGGRI